MATAKKKVVKKSSAKRSPAKSTPVKRTTQRKSVAATSRTDRRFMEARFTEQTVYWIALGAVVLALAVWVLSIQVQMNNFYDSIDIQNSATTAPAKKPAH